MSDPNDLETIRKLLLCDSDDDDDIALDLDESDTEEEEHVSERETDSESEVSGESSSEDKDNDSSPIDAYVAHLKKNNKKILTAGYGIKNRLKKRNDHLIIYAFMFLESSGKLNI